MRCNHCPKDKNAGRRGRLRQINQVPFLVFDHNTKVILPTPTHGFIVPIMAERISTKLDIPQPAENCTLVGVLERLEPNKPTHGRKIALVGPCCASLHMTFRLRRRFCTERWGENKPFHTPQDDVDILCSHKDYLFQRRAALRLPLDSFRFDFRLV